ncbi:MAG: AAA family ATPase [Desulfobacterales bacterium]|nr:AAA family ATPase [Desulfobacterales bacterium]
MKSQAKDLFPGYEEVVALEAGPFASFFKAVDERSQHPVLLKLIRMGHLAPSLRGRLKAEIMRLQSLLSDRVLRVHDHRILIHATGTSFLITLEAFGGTTLGALSGTGDGQLSPGDKNRSFCLWATQMAEAVRDLHAVGLIHRGLTPAAFFCDPKRRRLKLDGFAWDQTGLASRGNEGRHRISVDTLPYIAPEQTGRMNLAVDSRANLYSLGVLFYEMLTGRSPFGAKEASEILYNHMAGDPMPPSRHDPEIHPSISRLVLRMLSKHPDDRYQSIAGLLHDLGQIHSRLNSRQGLAGFEPARHDCSPVFCIPHRLCGREKEIAFLRGCYERVQGGDVCVVMISGDAGVGKTELARTLSPHVRVSGGIFLTAKYEHHPENTISGVAKVLLAGMMKWLLTQNPESTKAWRHRLLSAVSPNGRILIDLIPEAELIIGPQPPVCELPPVEARIRVHLTIEKAASLFISKDHPLVVLLDDMQWADKEHLELGLSFLLARQRQYLMLLGTYRDSAVDETSPVTILRDTILRTRIPFEFIHLEAMDENRTAALVAAVLGEDANASRPLARVVQAKTAGNPFFINQFLKSLHSKGLIRYDVRGGCWAYDVQQVAAQNITDNVATLLFYKIGTLPEVTLEVLQAAACIGHSLDVALLADILDRELPDIRQSIQTALEAGLLRDRGEGSPREDSDQDNRSDGGEQDRQVPLEFAHDQIVQAIYQTIPAEQARRLHWAVGKAMVRRNSSETTQSEIFDIVHHFRRGVDRAVPREEKNELARLNLLAGKKAMDRASFETALTYLRAAAEFLPGDSWRTHYEMTAAIHGLLAKCEFVLGHEDRSQRNFDLMLQEASCLLDKARVYNAMVVLHAAAGNIEKALLLGRQGLKLVGISLPQAPGKLELLCLLAKLRFAWGFRNIATLVDGPENKEEPLNITLTLMTNIGLPAIYVNPSLCLWLIVSGCILGIKNPKKGYPLEHASFGLIALGALIGSMFGLIGMGRMYGKIGRTLLKRYPNGRYQSIAYFVSALFNRHWHEPARQNIDFFKRAYRLAFKMGDTSYAGHSINFMFMTRLFLGDPLEVIHAYHKRHEASIKNSRSPIAIAAYMAITQFYLSLKGQTLSTARLDGDGYDAQAEYRMATEMGNKMVCFILLLLRLKLYVLYHEWEEALAVVAQIEPMAHIPGGTLVLTEYYFYAFLAATGKMQASACGQTERRCRRIMAIALNKMKRWVRLRPDNFEHMLSLMEAEREKICGRPHKALRGYRRAIELAQSKGVTHIHAMACELTGTFLLKQKDVIAARSYLSEARKHFSLWGATAKTADMDKRYGTLLESAIEGEAAPWLFQSDLKYVVDALQALSREIVVRKLLTQLMRIILESTGANRAVFITHKGNDLFVEAESRGGRQGETSRKSEPVLAHEESLMASVVYYVKRTQEMVVMEDVTKEAEFIQSACHDPAAPRSLLCLPMLRKQQLVGLLYLENTLTPGVFTKSRIEIIKMIAAQAAISFENATLYEHVITNEQGMKILSEKLRSLYSELILTEERERRRIATDLHDRIGHALATAKMNLEEMRDAPPAEPTRAIDAVIGIIEQSIEDTRTLTFELSPPILYHLGLGAAVDWLCEETQRKHGLAVTFKDHTAEIAMEQKISVLCFQICRELLFNAVKYARASEVEIALKADPTRFQMTIEDNGIGFDLSRQQGGEKEKSGGFGLFSINERLSLVGGRMRINTAPEHGTWISIEIPRDTSDIPLGAEASQGRPSRTPT